MGNCLIRNNKISSAQDHESYEAKVDDQQIKAAAVQQEQGMMKRKKVIRVKMQNDDGAHHHRRNSKSGAAVRIRVVMTQKELKRMLSCKDDDSQHTSLEQLLSATMMKLRGGRIISDKVGPMNSWRPDLESIPEDGFINF